MYALNTTITENLLPSQETFYNCYESEGFVKFQYTVDDLLLAASTASTVFNFLVIFCAFKLFKRSGDTMHLFIINMTLGDLLLTVFCHPNEFLMRKHTFLRHIHLCALIHFCNWLGLAVSGLSLTLLNFDKLIYFRWPLKYDQTMSKRRAIIFCFFIWSISLGFVSYVWIFDIVVATPDCMLQMTDKKKYFYEVFMIMFCVLPVTSSLFVSMYLFRLTRQKRSAPASLDSAQMDIRKFKNKVRSLVFIFATTVWTSFSLLPYRIFNICRIHLFDWNSISCEQRVLMNWLAWMLIYLLTLNPIINPLITSIIYAPYRMTLKKLLINIPIGNRLQYRSDNIETSYFSARKPRMSQTDINTATTLINKNRQIIPISKSITKNTASVVISSVLLPSLNSLSKKHIKKNLFTQKSISDSIITKCNLKENNNNKNDFNIIKANLSPKQSILANSYKHTIDKKKLHTTSASSLDSSLSLLSMTETITIYIDDSASKSIILQ